MGPETVLSRALRRQGVAAHAALEDCGTSCPMTLEGQPLAFKLCGFVQFFLALLFFNFSFRS